MSEKESINNLSVIEVCMYLLLEEMESQVVIEQNEKVFTYQALVYVIVAIALLSVLLFLLVSLLVYKKKCSLEQAKSCSLISTKEENQCTVINPGTVYPDLFAYINTSTTVDVKVTDQWDFVLQKLNSPAIMTEFKTLLPGLIHPHNVGKMLENKPKNRFQTILPYDHQRVVLDVTDSFTSDYINASYIDGYNKQNRYIATQGPSPDTIVDFWRMVWQTHAEKIVVLVNLQEIKSHGCAKYWPEIGKKLIYGSIEVSTVATVMYADFLIRKIKISMAETSRFIHQYHFKKWQDHGVPYYSTDLVKFRNKICSTSSENNSPIIVHCRAGVGRTGTFIALDILVDEGLQQGHVDILQCVQKLRQQRVSMVQNEMQYKFLHTALLESLLFCGTEISVCDFINVLPQIQNTSISGNFHKRMVEEYWKLKRYRVHKERQQSNFDVVDEKIYEIVDEKTPSQMKHLDNHKLAVNLSSYTQNNLFIVIQTPPEEMAAKFWEKVYKRKSQIVVMLDDCRTKEVVTRKYGSICMKVISKEEREHFTKAYIQLTNNMHATKEWFVTVFHFLCWPNDRKLPAGVSIFLNFVVEVMNCHKKVKMPIVVHCLLAFDIVFLLTLNVLLAAAVLRGDNIFRNGYKKTGLLCAVWNIIDMVEVDGVISVLQTVRSMNMVKWEFIGNYEQYEFCYKAIAQHLRNQ